MDGIYPSERFNPSFNIEDEESGMAEELSPVVMGPPGYASPDPRTNAGALVPLEDHPLAGDISESYGAGVQAALGVVPVAGTMSGTLGVAADEPALPDNRGEWSKANWQTQAKSLGLSTSGNTADIRARVEEHEAMLQVAEERGKELHAMTREELDNQAESAGIDPSEYSRKEDLADAILAAETGQ